MKALPTSTPIHYYGVENDWLSQSKLATTHSAGSVCNHILHRPARRKKGCCVSTTDITDVVCVCVCVRECDRL